MENHDDIKKELEQRKAELQERLANNMEKYHIGTPKQREKEQSDSIIAEKERTAKEILSMMKRFLELQDGQFKQKTVHSESKTSSLRKDTTSNGKED